MNAIVRANRSRRRESEAGPGTKQFGKLESPRPNRSLDWVTPDPDPRADLALQPIPAFDARGMRRIYGRSDHFLPAPSPIPGFGRQRVPAYCLDIWRAKTGRIFVRFWSRSGYVDGCAYELQGLAFPESSLKPESGDNEAWVPSIVRDAYETWVAESLEYPDD